MKLPKFLSSQNQRKKLKIIQKQAAAFLKMAEIEREKMQVFEQAIGISASVSYKWKAIREKFIQRISKDIAYARRNGLARSEFNPDIVARARFFTNEMYLWEIVRNEQQGTIEEIAEAITSIQFIPKGFIYKGW
jgi:hypothetical protein